MMRQGAMTGSAAQPPPLPAAGGFASPSTGPAGGAAPQPASADLLSVPQVAQYLGVSEADVMASVTSGDLKAKKIGAQYRITRAALDQFLAN
jgi:excisionase family DNA binding protein